MRKIRLGLTMGDPGGVGPEIILKTLCEPDITRKVDLCVIGVPEAVEDISKEVGISPLFREVAPPEGWTWRKAPFIHPIETADFAYGEVRAENGRLSVAALERAYDLVMAGYFDGIVTAPISKEAWHLAGMEESGHTDFFARKTGQDTVLMMVTGNLRVSLATLHKPLVEAVESLTVERLLTTIRTTQSALISRVGLSEPRIALAALNPHAGEGGLCGGEEDDLLRPAVEAARSEGIPVSGPVSADVVFQQAVEGRYDAVVALYHDQGLIPIKLHDFFGAVNVTLGLPFVRTSPGHGTAFDIARKGVANHKGMMEAVSVAAAMARRILFP